LRLGVTHASFDLSARDLAEITLRESNLPSLEDLVAKNWIDVQPEFRAAHFLDGFAWPDKKFRFRVDWPRVPYGNIGPVGPWRTMPDLPDHWDAIEESNEDYPFRLATSPSRSFLNSTFNETPSSRAREVEPCGLIHPDDAAALSVCDGDMVALGSARGETRLRAKYFDGVQRGVLISEGIWPNAAFAYGKGINTLTGAEPAAPFGGAAFHDNRVWVRRANRD
jgi:anaerobic selenocysteine-containing dehydrogenase